MDKLQKLRVTNPLDELSTRRYSPITVFKGAKSHPSFSTDSHLDTGSKEGGDKRFRSSVAGALWRDALY